VRFERSKLMGIDFTPVASNPELAFEDCDLRYASFSELNLRQATFLRCVAREANFLQVDLSDADFAGTELAGANFSGCTLTRTDFRLATGLALDPRRNTVKDTQVAVEAAVVLAHGMGLVVAGYGEVAKPKGKKRGG
jgi:fluoroquinolone resistance protein